MNNKKKERNAESNTHKNRIKVKQQFSLLNIITIMVETFEIINKNREGQDRERSVFITIIIDIDIIFGTKIK